jgi:phosphomannomutase
MNKINFIPSRIFKAYDIRGIYPEEINEETAYFIGRAFVEFIDQSSKENQNKPLTIVVGQDNRLSSASLFKSLVKGIIDKKGKVFNIGIATTPMLYFASAHYKFDGGIMISASHNPPQYNGFKMTGKNAISISGETGINEIKKRAQAEANSFFSEKLKKRKNKDQLISKKDILSDYLDFNFNFFNINGFKEFKIVVDTANAVPGILIPRISCINRIKIYHLFKKLDGSFPNHNPDPLVKDNLIDLKNETLSRKADFAIAFDGDGDRIVFLDEKGEIVPGDILSALLSKYILKDNPKEKILCDIRFSNSVRETIMENRGEPVVGRVGHSFIKEKMRKENILFAGEFSGHFYHRDHYFSEAPIFVFLKVLEILSQERKSLSEVIKPFKKYWHSGEINFKTKNKDEKIAQLKELYKGGEISETDGLRIDFAHQWWFLVRASNTEPLLRLIVEAEKSKKLMEEKVKELAKIISD